MAGLVINGVKFRPGQVEWEDAFGSSDAALPSFEAMKSDSEFVGTKITTIGMIGKIGKYILIITRANEDSDLYDYTLVPFTKAKITYSRRKK